MALNIIQFTHKFKHGIFISGEQNEELSTVQQRNNGNGETPSERNDEPLYLEYQLSDRLIRETSSTSEGNSKDNFIGSKNERTVRWDRIEPGKFLLVNFKASGSGKMYQYVCCVQRKDDDDGEVCVQGLSINNSAADEFIIKDEKDYVVNFDDILEILEDPKIIMKKRSIIYKFSKPVDVYEKLD